MPPDRSRAKARTPKRLLDNVRAAIRRERMLVPGDRVALAVSGGADSVALLRIFERLRAGLGITLAVVHFDHMLRGAASDADRDFVAKLAGRFQLEFFCAREDVTQAAARNHWNLEDAGRRLRYAFFERLVAQGQVTRVALAHTADDQAETVLAHLLRGTGLTGLAGIYPVAGPVIRPLLWTHRADLRGYLRSIRQPWREDATNRDQGRLRARIRAELLPLLERVFNPGAADHLAQLADFARDEEKFWRALVENRFRALVRSAGAPGNVGLPILEITAADLLFPLGIQRDDHAPALPSAGRADNLVSSCAPGLADLPQLSLTERLVRRICAEIQGSPRAAGAPAETPRLSAKHVEQVVCLAVKSSSGRRAELPRGLRVERGFGALVFSRAAAAISAARRPAAGTGVARSHSYDLPVAVPGGGESTITVPEAALQLRLEVIDWPPVPDAARSRLAAGGDRSENVAAHAAHATGVVALDLARLEEPLILRNWRPGDAYRPQGHRNRRKLKEMFVARRVPLAARGAWPIMECRGEIVWARGMLPAADFLAGETTRKALLISEVAWENRD